MIPMKKFLLLCGVVLGCPLSVQAQEVSEAARVAVVHDVIFPDDLKLAGDGMDDAPTIQRAVSMICNARDHRSMAGIIQLQARVYEIDSTVDVPCAVTIRGTGWQEQMPLSAGTWLHITSKGAGSPAIHVHGREARGTVIRDIALYQDHPAPSSVARTAWKPTEYAPAILFSRIDGGVFLNHLLFAGIYGGVYADGVGRFEANGIYGEFYRYGISIHHSYDVDRIYDVHGWGYYTQSNTKSHPQNMLLTREQVGNIQDWKTENENLIVLGRADTPFLDNIFGLGTHSVLQLTQDSNVGDYIGGHPSKIHSGKLSCDQSKYCLWVDNTTRGQVTGLFSQLDWQGEDSARLGKNIPDNAAIQLDGSAQLQIGDMFVQNVSGAAINMTNTSQCSNLMIHSMFGGFNQSPPSAPVAHMPACDRKGYNEIQLDAFTAVNNSGGKWPAFVDSGSVGHFLLSTYTEENRHTR
ncbi:hypothetical protein NO263_03470 [Gluconacetobacter entanii]|uniref:Pectate lyase superfamily protein domain-containing protein n=2 Tax=Gluconacetobacter entanii TaxID=108528 RepID=A0ABT3K2K2_9PROT|nr:hypothetical protein [Gluconacetobacter entanii]MCW4594847.1 hypothetical protein [Gluconacetobacter entanii]